MQAHADPLHTVPLVARALWGEALGVSPIAGADASTQRAVLTPPAPGERAGHWVLHLPEQPIGHDETDWALALACHTAAHRRFGGPAQARTGLKPIQQVLLGVLEDARVEALALQELPGLRAVWWPFHGGDAARRGNGFDDLLARLSASLLDPTQPEPHPWVARVRQHFFEADGRTLALRSPEAVRALASTLGNDIGQMRLPFNARTYRVHARYRDDNSHLWLPDDTLPASDVTLSLDADPPQDAGGGVPTLPEPAAEEPTAVHAEWDHRIRRYRADWCSVYTPPSTPPNGADTATLPHGVRAAARCLTHRLAALRGPPRRSGARASEGNHLHIAALVDAALDQRLGRTPDPRIHQHLQHLPTPLAVLLLVDASRSTAGPGRQAGVSVLREMQGCALTTALALQTLGHRTAVSAFSSHGRHRVHMPSLKAWGAPLGDAGLPALHSEGSTRLGAVLRHGLHLCAQDARQHPGWRRVILLVTDGELHDVDVHDPAYLGADLQRAMVEAARQGVAVRSLLWGDATAPVQRSVFGPANSHRLRTGPGFEAGLLRLLRDLD